MRRPEATDLDDRAALDFVLALRKKWACTLYPGLRAQFDERAKDGLPNEPDRVAAAIHDLPGYAWFAWLERGSQKMLWRAVSLAVAHREIEPSPEISNLRLELDPDLTLPDWYTDWDIHVQPGGVWSSDVAALIYEHGAKLVMLGDNDDYLFHRLFVATAVPERSYRCIVDLGCGFGKSTWPLKMRYPEADVIGVDLSAPCLRLAAERSAAQGVSIRFVQADAAHTTLSSGSADLVTSTMLIHEVPLEVLRRILAEASRLMVPGGLLRFLDFHTTGDIFRDLAMLEHGSRNNEPFMPPMLRADVVVMAEAAGLHKVRWTAFDERGAGRLAGLDWPDRAEWHFPWAVLEAEKPL